MRIGFESSSWTVLLIRLFPPASSMSASPTRTFFRLALDIVQTPARQVAYIDNTPMFVQIAEELGIQSILHTDYRSTLREIGFVRIAKMRTGSIQTANKTNLREGKDNYYAKQSQDTGRLQIAQPRR